MMVPDKRPSGSAALVDSRAVAAHHDRDVLVEQHPFRELRALSERRLEIPAAVRGALEDVDAIDALAEC